MFYLLFFLKEEEEEKVEIKDASSLQLKEIHIHVIFTFWKNSLFHRRIFSLTDT